MIPLTQDANDWSFGSPMSSPIAWARPSASSADSNSPIWV